VAVIVHPDVPVTDISVAELRRIFLGDRQFWNQELRITPLVPPQGSPARASVLELCHKSEAQYRHHWIAKVFRAEASNAPKVVSSPVMTGDLVRAIAGAISVVDATQVPRETRVLTVDGMRPGANGYPLR
jgi:ABC-type phosphate transport system substrate-binding protein